MEIQEYYPGIEPKGFIAHMPDDVYHATEGFISSSGLSLIARSPAHYFYAPPKERTRHMVIGSATHCAILEPERFNDLYMITSSPDRRNTIWNQAVKNRDPDYTLTKPEGDEILLMQESIKFNKEAHNLILGAIGHEVSLFTTDPVTGVKVRVRYDVLDLHQLGDLKTTQDARERPFMNSIINYMYHQQMALYKAAFEWETGDTLGDASIIAMESGAPHTTELYVLDDLAMAIGAHEFRKNLNTYAKCLESNQWGHYEGMGERKFISLPEWAIMQYEADTETDEVVV